MSEKAHQFRIGVFVVLGVAIVLAALFVFGIRSAFEPMHRFETYVPGDVNGLSVGSVVKLRGVAVGKVTSIGFSWNLYTYAPPRVVVVRFEIRESVSPVRSKDALDEELPKIVANGLRAVVQGEGITGTSILALQTLDPKQYPPLKVPWRPDYYYIPSAPSQFGQILDSITKTLAKLQRLDIAKLLDSFERTLASADRAINKLGDLDVKGISNHVIRVTDDASAAIREIQGLAQDARTTLQSMKLDAVSEDARHLLEDVDARLGALLDKLSAIDVRSLNETLAGTREAARSLNEALEELRRYPAGFLFGGPPEPIPGMQEQKEKK